MWLSTCVMHRYRQPSDWQLEDTQLGVLYDGQMNAASSCVMTSATQRERTCNAYIATYSTT